MKFGKTLRLYIAASGAAASWPHIEYKRLKDCIKATSAALGADENLVATGSRLVDALETQQHAESLFRKMLLASIAEVDASFAHQLELLTRSLDAAFAAPPSSSRVRELLLSLVVLNRYAVLNYLAVLKIVKKHDKRAGVQPIRSEALAILLSSCCVRTLLSRFFVDAEAKLLSMAEQGGLPTHASGGTDLLSIPKGVDGAPLALEEAIKSILGVLSAHYLPKSTLSSSVDKTPASSSVPRTAYVNFAMAYIGYACLLSCRKPFSAAKPYLVDEMGFPTNFLGIVDASMLLFYSLGSLLVGPYAL
ncbi:hypothetical protein AB1Y20_008175 [Prymnesium parvum]|uniref:SPX domain-containing protein n=1 Tax=Prymnesium parvum TaxID=97485 RepID=A0AB34IUP2_PRYPA